MDTNQLFYISVAALIIGGILWKAIYWLFFDPYGRRSCFRCIHRYRIEGGTINIHSFKLRKNPSREELDRSMALAKQRFVTEEDLDSLTRSEILEPDTVIATEVGKGTVAWIVAGKRYGDHKVLTGTTPLLEIREPMFIATMDQDFYRRRKADKRRDK